MSFINDHGFLGAGGRREEASLRPGGLSQVELRATFLDPIEREVLHVMTPKMQPQLERRGGLSQALQPQQGQLEPTK